MQEAGYTPDKPYRKSARVVGEVMGKYHPHGDAAIYDAMVRMAQTVLDARAADRRPGQFRLGRRRSAGGDALHRGAAGAAPRRCLLADIDKRHGRFPAELRRERAASRASCRPAFPNLLINGAGGIAVGMATNIPPHNPAEIIDATLALIADPDIVARRADEDRARPGFPDRRHDPRPLRHPRGVRDRPRLASSSARAPSSRRSARTARRSSSPKSPIR